MNPIEAMRTEIEYQLHDLQRQTLPAPDKKCLFVGSGDSYIAGFMARYISGRALCCYPTDVINNPSLVNGHNVYVISISGKTRANVLAAKIAKSHGARTTAITAQPMSRLAKACDHILELKYRSTGIPTAGTISFTVSMLTCISLSTKISIPNYLDRIYMQAEKHAEDIVNKIDNGAYFILGDDILYATANYAALKFNEVLGAKAFPYPAEEFCHSPLFSIKKLDQIIIMGGRAGARLAQRLSHEGFCAVHASFKSEGVELLLESIFFMQLLVLKLAQARRLTSCYFLTNKKLLKTSSDFIYG